MSPSTKRPDWVERKRAQYAVSTDTPSTRLAAQRQATREHHKAVWDNAYEQANAEWLRKPLTERLTGADGPELAELWVRCLAGDAELRQHMREVLDLIEEQESKP